MKYRNGLRALLFAGSALSLAAPASAQTANGDGQASVDEIVVTAQRATQNLQSTPLSVSAFNAAMLEARGLQDIQDLAAQTPSLSVKSDFGVANPNIFIRGVGITDFNANVTGAVGVYLDEVYQSSPIAQLFQFYDVERVEVLRGPQGTLYGRNTTGGAINIISRRPSADFGANGRLTLGSYNETEAQFSVTGAPAGGETLTARWSGLLHTRDGTIDNTFDPSAAPGRVNDINNWATRLLVDVTPTEAIDARLNLHYGRSDASGSSFGHRGMFNAPSGGPGSPVCSLADLTAFACVDAFNYNEGDTDPDTVAYDSPTNEEIVAWGSSATVDVSMGAYTLTSITGYERAERDTSFDVDDSPNPLVFATNRPSSDAFTQEVRLASPRENRLHWIVGGHYLHEDLDFTGSFRIFGGAVAWDYVYNQQVTSWAAFGQSYFDVTPALTATLGLRYSEEQRRFDYRSLVNGAPAVEISDAFNNNETSFDDLSWRAALEWQTTDEIFLYASMSRGSKSGGFNGAMMQDIVQAVPFDDEQLTAYEAGARTEWFDNRLRVNATAFFYNYRDLQVYVLQPPLGGPGLPQQVLSNAPEAEVYGSELEIVARPSEPLLLTFGASTLHTEVTAPFQSGGGGPNLQGHELPYAPGFTVSASATYTIALPSSASLAFAGDASFQEAGFTDILNLDRMRYGDGVTIGARVSYRPPSDAWELSIWGRNVTDERYLTYAADVEFLGFQRIRYNEPATYGVTLSAEF